jgi:hypothetical protein
VQAVRLLLTKARAQCQLARTCRHNVRN